MSDRQLGEFSNDISNFVQKYRQDWDNRLTFPPTDLCERYIRGELELRLHCQWKAMPFCLSIKRRDRRGSQDGEGNADGQVPCTHDENQCVMFVFTVKLVQDGEWIVRRIRSLVRLELFNESTGIGGLNSLYVSTVTGELLFLRLLSEDWKRDSGRIIEPMLFTRKHPGDVFQTGAQVVDDLPSENPESERNAAFGMELNKFLGRLLLIVTEPTFGAFLQEKVDLGIELLDSLIGPF
ncbi:MAG TPA: hypothetical protein VFF64_04190 [Candidatus Eremiobacteraceae bacterium]|nr:hypothetical protein [Candidatus Eremiobacteraceae bacterium]